MFHLAAGVAVGGGEEDLGGNKGSRDELIASSFIVSLSVLFFYRPQFLCWSLSLSLVTVSEMPIGDYEYEVVIQK